MSDELVGDCQAFDDEDDQGDGLARLTELFALADEIITAGFDVLPAAVWVKSDGTLGKAPLLPHGHLQANRDRQLIRQQLAAPYVPPDVPAVFEVVVGFVPGSAGHGVLDADVKKGKAGLDTLKSLVGEHGNFVTSAWRSPSGGVNVLWRKPPGAAYGNTSPWLRLGIDVRADGGWVVAPGNCCAGGAWVWIDRSGYTTASPLPTVMTDQLKAPSPPGRKATSAEVVAFIEASPTRSTLPVMQKFSAELDQFRSAEPGSRHEAMKHIVSWSFGMHALDLRWALERIKTEWEKLTAGEGRTDEVDDFACWVVPRESDQRAAQGVQPPPNVDPTTGEILHPMNLPESVWAERKVLRHIRQAAQARMGSPDAVLAECITRTAALIPPTLKLPAVIGGKATLDFISVVVADTSGGKGIAASIARELIPEPWHDPAIDSSWQIMMDLPIGSGEGIAQAFMVAEKKKDPATGKLKDTGKQIVGRTALHLSVDEGTAFVSQAERKGTTIIATLAGAWSGGALGNLNASKETKRLIEGGRVRVVAGIQMQAENGHQLLTPQFASVGLPGRILFATAHDPAAPPVDQQPDWPGELVYPGPAGSDVALLGIRYTAAIELEIRTDRHGVLTGSKVIDKRRSQAILLRCKIATVLAWWEGRLLVSDDDWRIARAILATSGAVLDHIEEIKREHDVLDGERRAAARGVSDAVAETARERKLIAEMSKRIVDRVPAEGIGRGELRKALTAGSTRHRFDSALDLAVANMLVVVEEGRVERGPKWS